MLKGHQMHENNEITNLFLKQNGKIFERNQHLQ